MDPVSVISLAASIVAVVQLTGLCLKLSGKLLGPSKHSSKDLQVISANLYSFNGALRNLQTHFEICEEDEGRLMALAELREPLRDCEKALKTVEEHLQGVKSIGKAISGVRFDSKLKTCMSSLEHSRALFNEALQADQK